MKKALLTLLFLVILSGSVTAEGIGVSPSTSELGTIDRGDSRTVEVYLDIRGYNQPIEITPSYQRPMASTVFGDGTVVPKNQYSAQDISSWVEFSEESYTVTPNTSYEVNGRSFDGKITYTIDVPSQGAEPGYHGGSIGMDISSPDDGEDGFGATFVTKGIYKFFFQVPGSAIRDIDYESRVLRTGSDQISVVSRFVNRGTVTTYVRDIEFTIEGGNLTTTRSAGVFRIPAGGTETVVTEIDSSQVSAGNYRIQGSANFMTGQATVSESFSLSDIVEVQPGQLEDDSSGPTGSFDNESLPLWLVVMLLVMVGVLMYSFGIDPIWIIAAVGVIGISVFILTSPVPDLLILVLLTITGALVYYGAI